MNRIFLLFMLLIATTNSYALDSQLWLDINIGSKHSKDKWYNGVLCDENWENCDPSTGEVGEYNENNLGAGLTYGITDYFDVLGGFISKNSFNNFSLYGGGNLKYPIFIKRKKLRFEPGIMLAVATGYEGTRLEHKFSVGDLTPFPLLNLTVFVYDVIYARVGYFPDLDGNPSHEWENGDRSGVITFQAGVKFF